jgi:hypothetical protein
MTLSYDATLDDLAQVSYETAFFGLFLPKSGVFLL